MSAAVWDEAWLERRFYGGSLPPRAERHLHLAARSYERPAEAEAYLQQALALAPDHIAVHLGLYRFYFYQNRLEQARDCAVRCLQWAAAENRLTPDWRQVGSTDADFGSYEAAAPRFYLFALKAYGYVQMRLGALDEGRAAIAKVLELDPSDKVGGAILVQVLDRAGQDND
jgi:tetratricopeptide (TPR) repeat protein